MQTTDNQVGLSLFSAKWLKIFGIVFILGGIAALAVPAIAGITIELLLGWLFFAGGCIQSAAAWATRKHKSFWFEMLWAILFVFVGLWLLLRPVEGVQALAFIVGALFLVEAIVKMIFSWQWRGEPNIGWILISGILSFIIGMVMLSGWPQQSATFIGLLIGINLLASGIAILLLGFKIKAVKNK